MSITHSLTYLLITAADVQQQQAIRSSCVRECPPARSMVSTIAYRAAAREGRLTARYRLRACGVIAASCSGARRVRLCGRHLSSIHMGPHQLMQFVTTATRLGLINYSIEARFNAHIHSLFSRQSITTMARLV